VIAALWKNDLRHFLILLNFIAFAALIIYLIWAVLLPRRRGQRDEDEQTPANLTPFYGDEDLEGRRLERVQGWALLFATVIAIALPIYWLREPQRQHESKNYFDKNSAHRGAVLFARPGTPEYDAATSKQCANCHGDEGEGGVATARIQGIPVSWKAPPLNTELLRFTQDPKCGTTAADATTVCEVSDIIRYGRPGTPMQGWGVAGGGPLNDQSINDLVNFIRSIQLTPAKSQAQVTAALQQARASSGPCPEFMSCPAIAVSTAEQALKGDQDTLNGELKSTAKAIGLPPSAPQSQISSECKGIIASIPSDPLKIEPTQKAQGTACAKFLADEKKVESDQATLDWTKEWQARRANVSDGQLLFELNCARCHTQGWSVFDPTKPPTPANPDSVNVLGLQGGGGGNGGGTGFNLRDGGEARRFGSDGAGGWQQQYDFVAQGSMPFKAYGNLGIGSGRMPGFGQMLTPEQLGMIISYERDCLEATDFTKVSPVCETPAIAPPTTTTTLPSAKG
jgi:mono/diheme cytochrome c family protein